MTDVTISPGQNVRVNLGRIGGFGYYVPIISATYNSQHSVTNIQNKISHRVILTNKTAKQLTLPSGKIIGYWLEFVQVQ